MKKIARLAVMAVMVGVIFTGCGVQKPDGTYTSKWGSSLRFGKETVVVTENENSTTLDYEMDSDGNITIDPSNEQIPATYDVDTDTIDIDGDLFSK